MDYKNKIRRHYHKVPTLIKAAYVSQALALERAIADTFGYSDGFATAVANSEDHLSDYREVMLKSFEAGYNNAKIHGFTLAAKEDRSRRIEARKLPINKTVLPMFAERMKDKVKTKAYVELLQDAENAYVDGVLAFNENPTPEPAVKKEEKKENPALDTESGAPHQSSSIKALEDYTKLLGNKQAEMVLRYTLGLPPKRVGASASIDKYQDMVDPTQEVQVIKTFTTTLSSADKKALTASLNKEFGVSADNFETAVALIDEKLAGRPSSVGGSYVLVDHDDRLSLVHTTISETKEPLHKRTAEIIKEHDKLAKELLQVKEAMTAPETDPIYEQFYIVCHYCNAARDNLEALQKALKEQGL